MTKSGSDAAPRSGSPRSATTGGPASPKASTRKGSTATPPPERPKGTRIIAIANQKGGVGKSTTAVSLGAALAEHGRSVLVLDLDPQGNASTGLGIRHDARDVTVYDVVVADAPIQDAIVQTPVERLWAVPSTIDLAGAEIELVSQFSRELRLRKALDPLASDGAYDYILLDCPPSLGLLTINALAAARELIVPIQCEYYALEGLGQLLRNVSLVQQNINPGLQLTGIVMTMYDPRTKLSEQVVEEVQRYFGDRVYDVIIPRTVRLSEAPGFGQPITVYDPRSKGAETYRRLAVEVDEKPPPAEPMPALEDLPTVVVAPPGPPTPSARGDEEEIDAPVPRVRDLAYRDEDPTPMAQSPPPPPPMPQPAPPPPSQPEPPPSRPQPKPAPPTSTPDASPTAPGAATPAVPGDDEAAAWLEELALEAERATEVTSSEILAEAALETEKELDEDEVWEPSDTPVEPEPEPAPGSAGTPTRLPHQRVVVIDENTDIPASQPTPGGSDPGEPRTAGARVGATLEDEGSHKKRWRLFRRGGE